MKAEIISILLSVTICISPSYTQPIEEAMQDLDGYITQIMHDWRIPSMAIGIVEGQEIAYIKGYGYRNIENVLPVDENTLFPVDGIDINFSNACIAILQDQGRLNIDEPLKTYLPNLKMYNEYVTNHVTLRDFMTLRTGLPNHGFLWYGTDYSREQVIKALEFMAPLKGFRERHSSTLSPYVTKYVVDRTSGMTYEEFAQKHLFEPLGMYNTCFGHQIENAHNVALPYHYNPDTESYELAMDQFKHTLNLYNGTNNPGVLTSAQEMCHWMIACLNEGRYNEENIIPDEYLAQAQSLQHPSGNSNYSSGNIDLGTSFGSFIYYFHGHHLVSSYGHRGPFDTRLMLFPHDSIGIVVLTGSTFAGRWIIGEIIAEKLILDKFQDWNTIGLNNPTWTKELEQRPKPERSSGLNTADPPTLNLHEYTGIFAHKGYGEIAIKEENGLLKGKRSITQYDLDHLGGDRFKIYVKDSHLNFKTMQFHIEDSGEVTTLTVDFESTLPPIVFTRVN